MRLVRSTKKIGIGIISLLLIGAVMGPPQKAGAHYVYNSGYIHKSNDDCVKGYSEISHGVGHGYAKSELRSEFYNNTPCGQFFYRPAGYLKIRQIMRQSHWSAWLWCRDSGNLYNTTNAATFDVKRTFGNNCGADWYDTLSTLRMYNQNTWKGGDLYSGQHWLN